MTDLVSCIDVGHRFGSRRELFGGVDLTIGRHDSVAITGPSGVGKSTLLSFIGGIASPDLGVVRHSQPARKGVERLSSIAWVLQTGNVLGNRSVLSNIALPAVLAGQARGVAASRAEAVASQLGIDSLLNNRARTLSGGELQRVSIARSLASSPDLILADEPTGQLDTTTSETVVEALLGASSPHRPAVVVVTHDLRVAQACERHYELTSTGLQQW